MNRKFLKSIVSKFINTGKMECAKIHTDYICFLEGGLDSVSQKKVEEHLLSCNYCREFVEKLKDALDLIKNEKSVSPDPFMFTRIQLKVSEPEKNMLTNRLKVVLQTAAAILLIITGTWSGMKIGKSFDKLNDINSDYQTEIYYLYDIQQGIIETELLSDITELP